MFRRRTQKELNKRREADSRTEKLRRLRNGDILAEKVFFDYLLEEEDDAVSEFARMGAAEAFSERERDGSAEDVCCDSPAEGRSGSAAASSRDTFASACSAVSSDAPRGECDVPSGESGADEPLFDGEKRRSRSQALRGVSATIREGEFVAILGANGSGKSTLARHINALLLPQRGRVLSLGMDTSDESLHAEIHRHCGMVFQNPDNQIVGTTVEEDIAFGLENLAIPSAEIRQRVAGALRLLKMEDFAERSPNGLSGGQKQKVAIAGILAMNPSCLILDESTSMLDPLMRRELLAFLHQLRRGRRLSLILVTHYMDEALDADRIYLMNEGRISPSYRPSEFFSIPHLSRYGLEIPPAIRLNLLFSRLNETLRSGGEAGEHCLRELCAFTEEEGLSRAEKARLRARIATSLTAFHSASAEFDTGELSSFSLRGADAGAGAFARTEATVSEASSDGGGTRSANPDENTLAESLERSLLRVEAAGERAIETLLRDWGEHAGFAHVDGIAEETSEREMVLRVRHLSYRYPDARPDEAPALTDFSMELRRGECVAVAGQSGSGKSTLMMHLNGLLPIQDGEIEVLGMDVREKQNLKRLRAKLGLLFQYPEHQLFAETLLADISFGPRALGFSEEEALRQAREAAFLLSFTEEDLARSPFSFSGGQMRKAALAGVLASLPEILVLDEPAAGLDPQAKQQFMSFIQTLKEKGHSILLVSHNVDDLARYADRVILLREGKKTADGATREILSNETLLTENALELPSAARFMRALHRRSGRGAETALLNASEAAVELLLSCVRRAQRASADGADRSAACADAAGQKRILEERAEQERGSAQ